MLLADVNTRAVAFGDVPAYTQIARLPEDPLADAPLPAPTRMILWLWEGERWMMKQLFT